MSEVQRINITLPRKLVSNSKILIDEGLYSSFSELVRESIKNEILLDKSLLDKKTLLNKWFAEEGGKGFDTSNLPQDELIKRIRRTRDSLWEDKYRKWLEESAN